jgi:hypothetical protein
MRGTGYKQAQEWPFPSKTSLALPEFLSTVSRALRGSALIPLGTREPIQRIAAEHNYSVSVIARSLVTQTKWSCGLPRSSAISWRAASLLPSLT